MNDSAGALRFLSIPSEKDTIDITAVVEVRIENETNVQLLLHGNNSEEEINFLQSLTRMIQEDLEKSKTAK